MTIVGVPGLRVGDGTASTAGTTLTVTNTTAQIIPAGTLVHIAGCWDNIASVTAPTITCSTIGGATAIANHATAIGSGVTTTAGSGIWHTCFRAVTTAAVAAGAVLATLTSDQSAVKRAAYALGWSGALATLRGTVATGVSTTGSPTVTTAGASMVAGDLVIGSVSFENSAQMISDADVAGSGSWTSIIGTFTTGGAAGTNVGVGVQFKVIGALGTQTFNPTGGVADTVACVYAVPPQPAQTITQAAYRFYADDNSETASTALAAQNTAYTVNLSTDVNLQVRLLLQSTNATTIPATDDFQLQYEKNASGTWLPVSTVSSVVTAFASAFIADGQTITNRLTGGTGTYATGNASKDGLVDNLGWTGNNYTELLYAITLKQADLVNGDTVRLRITDSNTEPVFTYTQVPTIPIVKQATTQAAYRFYADGSEAGSTALAAQDTAYTANVGAGDTSLQLRTRLQSTTLADIDALSDFRLQWEKNASGTWTDVAISTPTLSDAYYPDFAWTNAVGSSMSVNTPRSGQSFLGNGQALSRVGFALALSGAVPDGTLTAFLYAHSGTFGVDGVPTGAALATSTTTISPSTLLPGTSWAYFDFDGTFTLANGTPYFAVLTTTTTSTSAFTIPVDNTSPTHPGRFAVYTSPTGPWVSAANDFDTYFEIYTKPASAPTTVIGTASPIVLADSYAESNVDGNFGLYLNKTRLAQSFLGNGQALSRAGFFMNKFNTPNGTVTAVLYAHTGTFGVDGTPTGAALASSSTVRNVTSYSGLSQWSYFDFDGTFTLTNGTPYFIALVVTNTANIANTVQVWYDSSSSSHPGTSAQFDTGNWFLISGDLAFLLYTQPVGSVILADGAPTTNRLTGGTGTFQAGEVALDGQVDDLGWTGNNYTELLYVITLLKANLADSDTLRFRVLRNGSTVGQTYTLTPTIPITVGAVPVVATLATSWNVRAAAVKTLAQTWNVRVAVGPVTLATSWNVRASAVTSLATSWNVRAPAVVTLVTNWNIRAPATRTLVTNWNIRAPATAALVTNWNVRVAAGITLVTSWNVRSVAAVTLAQTWAVRTVVSRSLAQIWSVRTVVGQSLAQSWNIRVAVGPVILAQSWAVRASVGPITMVQTWAVRSVATVTLVQTWNVRAAATATLPTNWNVRVAVGPVTLVTSWNVRAGVTTTLVQTWNVSAGVIVATLATNWNVRAYATATLPQTWNIRVLVGQTLPEAWNIRVLVGQTLIQTWVVRSAATVTLAQIWNVRAAANKTLVQNWNVRAKTTATLVQNWNIRVSVGKTLAQTWSVRVLVGKTLVESWNVRSSLSEVLVLLATSWNVRAPTASTLAESWNVRTTVLATLSTSWKILQASGQPKVWNGTAWVAKPFEVWNGTAWVIKPMKVWNGTSWNTVGH